MPPKEGEQSGKSGTLAGMRDAMKKATTEMLILFLLRQKEMYVYEMIQEMARLTGGVLTFNTLYLLSTVCRSGDRSGKASGASWTGAPGPILPSRQRGRNICKV